MSSLFFGTFFSLVYFACRVLSTHLCAVSPIVTLAHRVFDSVSTELPETSISIGLENAPDIPLARSRFSDSGKMKIAKQKRAEIKLAYEAGARQGREIGKIGPQMRGVRQCPYPPFALRVSRFARNTYFSRKSRMLLPLPGF